MSIRNWALIIGVAAVSLAVVAALLIIPGFPIGGLSGTVSGAGKVTFGTQVDSISLQLVGPVKTSFSSSDNFAYRAVLLETAKAATLRLIVAQVNDGGSEQGLIDQQLTISNPNVQVLANQFPMSGLGVLLTGRGNYVRRILRDTTVLAQGTFQYLP